MKDDEEVVGAGRWCCMIDDGGTVEHFLYCI